MRVNKEIHWWAYSFNKFWDMDSIAMDNTKGEKIRARTRNNAGRRRLTGRFQKYLVFS